MRLPSLDVALAYVRARGGDEIAWKTWWEAAHAATNHPEESDRVSGGEDGSTPGWFAADTTSFIGREHELEADPCLLQQARLVTLTGAGREPTRPRDRPSPDGGADVSLGVVCGW